MTAPGPHPDARSAPHPTAIAIVDLDNRFLRWSDRAEVHGDRRPHRSVQILVFDSAGKLWIQRRHPDKQTCPNFWDVSASGHVEASDYLGGPDERLDEVYRGVAERELAEELGVKPALTFLAAEGPRDRVHYEFFHLFRAVSDGPVTIQEEEVSEVRRVTAAELLALEADPEESVTRTLSVLARRAFGEDVLGPVPEFPAD